MEQEKIAEKTKKISRRLLRTLALVLFLAVSVYLPRPLVDSLGLGAGPLLSAQDTQGTPEEGTAAGQSENSPKNLEGSSADQPTANEVSKTSLPKDLIVKLAFSKGKGASLTYALNYQYYPSLVAAFLYFIRQEAKLYQTVQYASVNQRVYGNGLASLPNESGIYSLPNISSTSHPQPGLAFWRNGSILRSDILVLNHAEVGVRDQNNLVFFADLQGQPSKVPASIPLKQGLKFISVEAFSPDAKEFLAGLSDELSDYQESLEQTWGDYIREEGPALSSLLQQNPGWKRNAFGYYYRIVQQGKGSLPVAGEDLNITLERKAFAGVSAQSLPVIVSFGRDALPMPFDYFVAISPKGSRVEIMCPPSTARHTLSTLPAEYGRTRYQWLQESYASDTWVYLSFALEIP